MERGCQRYTHVKPAISVSGPRYAEEERERVREGKDLEGGVGDKEWTLRRERVRRGRELEGGVEKKEWALRGERERERERVNEKEKEECVRGGWCGGGG